MRTLTIRCLESGIRLGHLVFQARNDFDAIRQALHMARRSNPAASVKGLTVYPDGRTAWTLAPQSN